MTGLQRSNIFKRIQSEAIALDLIDNIHIFFFNDCITNKDIHNHFVSTY